jgi:hypothetical protein
VVGRDSNAANAWWYVENVCLLQKVLVVTLSGAKGLVPAHKPRFFAALRMTSIGFGLSATETNLQFQPLRFVPDFELRISDFQAGDMLQ